MAARPFCCFLSLCRPCILVCIRSLRLSPMLLASSSVRPSTYGTIAWCLLKTWESRLSWFIKSAFGPKKTHWKYARLIFSNIFGKYRSVAFFQLWWALGNFWPNSADLVKESTTSLDVEKMQSSIWQIDCPQIFPQLCKVVFSPMPESWLCCEVRYSSWCWFSTDRLSGKNSSLT